MNTTKCKFITITTLFLTLFTFISATVSAAPAETMRIWRVQIQFQTPNVSDAGSDDSVRVQLNSSNSTWLDYGRDDFARNTTQTYDLKLNGLNTLNDLRYIYISKTGSDGWLIKTFSLLVNGRTIYTQTFPGNGRWLDNDSGNSLFYFVNFTTLRANLSWANYVAPLPPFVIPRTEMESRVEGLVGDFIHGNELEWGHLYGRAVEATRKNANTLHFDLDLKAAISYLPDPEVDVDFDVEVTCSNGTISMKVKNVVVDVDSNPILRILTLNLITFLDNYLTDRINDAMKNIKIGQNVSIGFCPGITIASTADVVFSLPTGTTLPVFALREMEAEAEDASAVVSEENRKPLQVMIETEGQVARGGVLPYRVSVQANNPTAAGVDVQIELPAQARLSSALLEAVDEVGNRTMIGAQAIPSENGTSLRFRDYLNVGARKTYTVNVQLEQSQEALSTITTKVTSHSADDTAPAVVEAVTTLQNDGDLTNVKATLKRSKVGREVEPRGRQE